MITACFIVIPTTENSEYFFFLKSQVATDHHFQQKSLFDDWPFIQYDCSHQYNDQQN